MRQPRVAPLSPGPGPSRGPLPAAAAVPPQSPGRRARWAVLGVLAILVVLVTMVGVGLGRVGGGRRPAALLLGDGRGEPEVIVESPRFALPPSTDATRFDSGWQARQDGSRRLLVPVAGSGRLLAVNLGEEVERTLTLDLAPEAPPEDELLSVRVGEREVARGNARAAALRLEVRLPEDLPVGQVPLDLLFGARPGGAGKEARRTAPPALVGASLQPVLPPGSARREGADLVQGGSCLVYLHCALLGDEALVGAFVPPDGARAGQRFELSVERLDGTPIRRFRWLPSFWNRLRGARRFELPLRQAKGPVRLRLISRAGPAGGPPGRWLGLGLASVAGEILTPGQGQ
jgi:hypothetical protein